MRLFLFLFFFSFSSFANLAKISKLDGQAIVNIKKTAKVGMILKEFDVIETVGKKGFVEITFSSGHKVRLRAGKTVLKRMNKDETVFKLIKGKIFSFVNKLNSKQKFKVETKHSSLGVRGTMFMISVEKDKSYLCVCEGSVETDSASKTSIVNKGEDQFLNGVDYEAPRKANSQMMTMATDEFKSMGFDL
jgi:hypothetical protein